MKTPERARSNVSDAYRDRWLATIPFSALVVLAQVGAILSFLFRSSPAASGAASFAALYALGMLTAPVLIACLLVGYARARVVLVIVLWGYLLLTLANLAGVYELKRKAAFGLLPFVVAQAGALWLGHGTRLRVAVAAMDARRVARWGNGFGWMLAISGGALFGCASTTVLIAVELARAGGPDLLLLPGILRLLAPAIGIGAAVLGLARVVQSRAPMAWISSASLAALTGLLVRQGVQSTAGAYALVAMCLNVLVLLALAQPSLKAFCERERKRP